MEYKKLNEALIKFLEGDVVSFADFKNRKERETRQQRSQQFLKDNEKELTDMLSDKAFLEIEKVKIIWAEGRTDGTNSFQDGEELSFDEFQRRAYEYNYVYRDRIGVDKVKISVYFNYTCKNEQVEDHYNMYVYIGDDKNLTYKECDLEYLIQRSFKEVLDGKELIIKNDTISKNIKDNNLQYAKIEPEEVEEAPKKDLIPAKDYGAGKGPKDVQVGDILVRISGYSMILVNFYRVIERKNASIRLEELDQTVVSGQGGYQGTSVPVNKVIANKEVDGKLFRFSKYGICQINGHYCNYWNGKPVGFDYMD